MHYLPFVFINIFFIGTFVFACFVYLFTFYNISASALSLVYLVNHLLSRQQKLTKTATIFNFLEKTTATKTHSKNVEGYFNVNSKK